MQVGQTLKLEQNVYESMKDTFGPVQGETIIYQPLKEPCPSLTWCCPITVAQAAPTPHERLKGKIKVKAGYSSKKGFGAPKAVTFTSLLVSLTELERVRSFERPHPVDVKLPDPKQGSNREMQLGNPSSTGSFLLLFKNREPLEKSGWWT